MQIINNTGAIIKEQINLGDIDNLFKNNTNNKKMKNNNYPSWLVSLEIAKELKEIGFNKKTMFYFFSADTTFKFSISEDIPLDYILPISDVELDNYNRKGFYVSIPTWEQVFDWFREKKIYGNVNQEWEYGRYNSPIGLNYFYVINDCRKKKINKTKAIVNGGFDNYEEAREELVKTLIQT